MLAFDTLSTACAHTMCFTLCNSRATTIKCQAHVRELVAGRRSCGPPESNWRPQGCKADVLQLANRRMNWAEHPLEMWFCIANESLLLVVARAASRNRTGDRVVAEPMCLPLADRSIPEAAIRALSCPGNCVAGCRTYYQPGLNSLPRGSATDGLPPADRWTPGPEVAHAHMHARTRTRTRTRTHARAHAHTRARAHEWWCFLMTD